VNNFTAADIAGAVSGDLVHGNPNIIFSNVSTDTRQINEGDLFIALIGERFDAHDFIDKAIEGKAGGLVISRPVDTGSWQEPVIMVNDTLMALQDLARYNRRNFHGPVVGVTGSNGKTTTKDMISAVLEQKYKTLKTHGNFNNEIGLPLTLLKLDSSFGAAVLEMGMRGIGEIDLLARITQPDGAVITNIGETHLERLGSIENIARAKGEILDHIRSDGFAVLNGDDILVRKLASRCKGRVIFYGTGQEVNLPAYDIRTNDGKSASFRVDIQGEELEIKLPVPGRHNVLNALAAVAVGLECGLTPGEIKTGLESARLTSMRLEILEGKRATVINDSYNANPASTKAALEILAEMGAARRKVAILGDMYELGARTVEGHREVGAEAASKKVDVLIAVGKLAHETALGATLADDPPPEVITLNTNAEVERYLDRIIRTGDVVLVKGSRGMKLEEVVGKLLELD